MIEIPDLGAGFLDMWRELLFLTEHAPAPWTLIGAHMVALHGWRAGREQPRASRDADILVNVRAAVAGTQKMSEVLTSRGFILDGVSPEGIGHRFVRGSIRFDVLGPDSAGSRTSFKTIAGAQTVAVPGGSQALRRTELMGIRAGTSYGSIPVPTLLGAILVKARAISVDDQPQAQRTDLAFLLSLVAEPDLLLSEMSGAESGWLRRHPEMADPGHGAYAGILNPADAATVFRRLSAAGARPDR